MGVRRADDVHDFLDKHDGQFEFSDQSGKKKVRCVLTGHELPARIELLESYVKGKSFKKASKSQTDVDFSKYEPNVVQHKTHKDKLFCVLTKKTLNRDVAEVEMHLKGRRYLNTAAAQPETGEKSDEKEAMDLENDSESGLESAGSDQVIAENVDSGDDERQNGDSSSSSDSEDEKPARKSKRGRRNERKVPKKVRRQSKRVAR